MLSWPYQQVIMLDWNIQNRNTSKMRMKCVHCGDMSWQCICNNTLQECQQFVPLFCPHLSAKKKNGDSMRLMFFWDTIPQQRGIGFRCFESVQCTKLQGSTFIPLRIFTDISEEYVTSNHRAEQSVKFYQIIHDHVPQSLPQEPHISPQAYFIKASHVVRELK
jgi:hypothetical protein